MQSNEELITELQVSKQSDQWRFVARYFDELESNSRYLAVDGVLIDEYEEAYNLADQQSKKVQQQITVFHPAAQVGRRRVVDIAGG